MDAVPKFSRPEVERRFDRARELMDEHGLDALLVYGSGANNANLCWLSNHRDSQGAHLVVPRNGEPTLLVGFLNHLPNARERAVVPAEWGTFRPARRIAALLREAGARSAGLVGGRASYGFGMPYLHYQQLREQAPEIELIDVTPDYDVLTHVKSEEEVVWMRRAAQLTDLALRALVEGAKPGVSEHELVAMAEYAYRREGGEVGITFLRSMPMDAPNGIVPAQRPSDRRLETGDVIICELSAVYGGYSGQVLWPIFVGAEPTPEWQHLFDTALDAYRGLERSMRHDATVAEAIESASAIRGAGYSICDSLVHGIGLGLHPPFIGPDDLDAASARSGERLQRGVAVVLQPNPVTADERMGIQLGSAGIIRDGGFETLHDVPSGPLLAAA